MCDMINKSSPVKSSDSLPSYKRPPINEVVCGVRFNVPDGLKITHIGQLWDKFKKDYPIVQHVAPIASGMGELIIDTATGAPIPRVWFINKSDDQLIQFQFNRFYYNWRRRKDDYPRYGKVVGNFDFVISTIAYFFKEFELGEIEPIEYELSYINHIPKKEGWNEVSDLSNVFSSFIIDQKEMCFLPKPEKISWSTEFLLPEEKGRLGVSLRQAIRTTDKSPIFILELKAIGINELTKEKGYREWFDLAHEWIVRGFTDLTTAKMHKYWEKEDNA